MNISPGEIIVLMLFLSFGGFFMYIVYDLVRYDDESMERMRKNKAEKEAAEAAESQA